MGTFITDSVLAELMVPIKHKTSLTIKTMTGSSTETSALVEGLIVKGSDQHVKNYPLSGCIQLPGTYTRAMIPIEEKEIATPERAKPWKHLQRILNQLPSYDSTIPVGLLIGVNCPKALEPHEVIPSADEGPYAVRSQLGWCVVGPLFTEGEGIRSSLTSFRIAVKDAATNHTSKHHFAISSKVEDVSIKEMLFRMYDSEFADINSEKKSLSQEDNKFMSLMQNNIQLVDGHYEVPLPFREEDFKMPDNRKQVYHRTQPLRKRFLRNPQFHKDYLGFMNNLLEKGYARKADVQSSNLGEFSGWFIPHHGLYNPNKPGKIRVVFDCSASYGGKSLNSELLQGPDMTNLLTGVLIRFRKEEVPFMADIESMFYQVRIPEQQRKFVRFLWWPDGDLSQELCEFEMCVHLFGAVSSPGCSNFALRQSAIDNREKFGEAAYRALTHDFYVDDILKSCHNEEAAGDLAVAVDGMCASGGFNLTKFVSTSSLLINKLPPEKRSEDPTNVTLPEFQAIARALGISWCMEKDIFKFRITLQDKPLTRRGILSTINSIYDPLGLLCPFLLQGKRILQEVVSGKGDWDDRLSEEHACRWTKWRSELCLIEGLEVSRCFKPKEFGAVVDISLHNFSDASESGYGMCSYLRQVNDRGQIHVALVMAKSRVTPLKTITIPRLELNAASLSSRVGALLMEELMVDHLKVGYWVDSRIVLGYIFNEVKRFRIYVANRVQKIRSCTDKSQWKYVETRENPADDVSRGLSLRNQKKVDRWYHGPAFLWRLENEWNNDEFVPECLTDDEEVKAVKVNSAVVEEINVLHRLEDRVSSWMKMKRIVAWVQRFIENCRNGAVRVKSSELSVVEIKEAEIRIIRSAQERYFTRDIAILKMSAEVTVCGKGGLKLRNTNLATLDPFLDDKNILRVGGRLRKGNITTNAKFPIIIPKKIRIAIFIVEWCHQIVQHSGRMITLNEVRSHGYWIINGNALVRSIVYKCVTCRYFRGKFGQQKMGDLPEERIEIEAPFTYCGVDIFGPFYIKEGRKEMKRYAALFTCFSLRAIHIETTCSLETDSFILALRRFIARRGTVRYIRSDNGTNFVGADNELRKAIQEMDHEKIEHFLSTHGCDWIRWERNPPTASHMGGVWERQIRSIRNILQVLLKNHAHILNDESLRTLLLEAECIVNSRPLTVENISDPNSLPLSPNQLLTMKAKVVLPPPGVFQKEDTYSRKRWRRVQYLANEFWQRWRTEYLNSLQTRSKWSTVKRNFKVNDVVLLKDESLVRTHWPLGRIIETFPDSSGLVRSVALRTAKSTIPVKRPISKLVLLVEGDDK